MVNRIPLCQCDERIGRDLRFLHGATEIEHKRIESLAETLLALPSVSSLVGKSTGEA